MAELTHLNEASVVHNLDRRFKNDRIYVSAASAYLRLIAQECIQTYSGPFLVAVNPYKRIDAMYSAAAVKRKRFTCSS